MRPRPLFALGRTVAALLLCAVPALARDSKLIDVFNDWEAYAEDEDGKKLCFIGSVPKKKEGKYTQRGDTHILVAHRPAEKNLDVVSIKAGYVYRKGTGVEVTIGGQRFELRTQGGYAWAKDSKTDRQMVAAMKGGKTMVVKGTSSRGTLTTDTYSLAGFTAAHGAIGKACPRK